MRRAVDSSSFASVGYLREDAVLEVQFRDGEVYRYFEVPLSVYERFMEARSKGTFFHQAIKGSFRFERVPP